ncbi:FMN-binding negative transcriptional regulator [Thetidibacter halocola]|uniref:FMN-binding negative transcriptional regulator n=1 Tax=Thetidibacter halocola TaxID=2827239 RepID=A0A8J7WJ50_9RHOB|nr:FMN-binding negative transcriptional regulator [Thetidibacter halocola]MBS0125964.1 FMN-binding negative transcriptional regulator [Thetidibacter halocola]
MHPNPIYRKTDAARSLAFARDRGFGVLAIAAEGVPHLAHIPFLVSDDGGMAELHLVRSNPIARALKEPMPARLDVLGPDGYVSPDWYGIDDQVPTWNYVAVSFTGLLHPMPHDTLDSLLARQSAAYEGRLLPKKPWTMDKLTEETHQRFLRSILPFRLEITDIQSTWKLSQNKPDDARIGAAAHMPEGMGQGLEALAALMADPPSPKD